jgi:hypothetical protein
MSCIDHYASVVRGRATPFRRAAALVGKGVWRNQTAGASGKRTHWQSKPRQSAWGAGSNEAQQLPDDWGHAEVSLGRTASIIVEIFEFDCSGESVSSRNPIVAGN